MNYNLVTLAGNLTRDVELKRTPSDKAVANTGIAVNRKWKSASGEGEKTMFIDLVIWGSQGETAAANLKKGSAVFLEGELEQDTWQDKTTGKNRSKHLVNVRRWQFLNAKDKVEDENDGSQERTDDF